MPQTIKQRFASRKVIFLVDIAIAQLGYLFASSLYFSMVIDRHLRWDKLIAGSLLVATFTILAWSLFHITRRIVRYSNQGDYLRLLAAAFLVNGFGWLVSVMFPWLVYADVQLWIISFLFQSVGLVLLRILIRYLFAVLRSGVPTYRTRLMIYGSGELGQSLKKALESDAKGKYELVGFLDDDYSKIGKYVDGVRVFNGERDLRDTIITQGIEEVIIAVNNLSPGRKARLIEDLIVFDLRIKELPPLKDWYAGGFSANKLASININDLLNRDPILIYNEEVRSICADNVVLVTGAAGSIGSEIVRKLAENGAREVICLDQAETPLHALQLEMQEKFPGLGYRYVVADISDKRRMEDVLQRHRPRVLFHAAAYKHVPLMENNTYEAVKTNVEGTRRLADLAVIHGVQRFVMISSDKAVNPTNVMGATKRVAEAYVQALQTTQSTTRFITTRFGNVLGSNGSVIPLFTQQIAKGGPVTVTHPDMVRYFMTIPEACSLVLEAAVMGKGGEVFVFEMGKPVRILDLAKSMIRLSGLILGKDIQIEYTGMRPGEKLFEELFTGDDNLVETHHPKIMIGRVKQFEYESLNRQLDALMAIPPGAESTFVEGLKGVVAEYSPMSGDR